MAYTLSEFITHVEAGDPVKLTLAISNTIFSFKISGRAVKLGTYVSVVLNNNGNKIETIVSENDVDLGSLFSAHQILSSNVGFVFNPAAMVFDCRNITIDRLIFKFDQTTQGDTALFNVSAGDTNTIKNVRVQNCVFLVKSPNGQSGLYDSTDGFDTPSSYFVNNTIIIVVAAVGGQVSPFLLGANNHIGENNIIVIVGVGTHTVGDGATGWDYLNFYKTGGSWAGTDGWTPGSPPTNRWEGNPNFVDLNADIFVGDYDLTSGSTIPRGKANVSTATAYDIKNRSRT